jgi:hypothetical protein
VLSFYDVYLEETYREIIYKVINGHRNIIKARVGLFIEKDPTA